jgi:hypothetical protein
MEGLVRLHPFFYLVVGWAAVAISDVIGDLLAGCIVQFVVSVHDERYMFGRFDDVFFERSFAPADVSCDANRGSQLELVSVVHSFVTSTRPMTC